MNNKCNICPRKCNIDRSKQIGFCGTTNKILVAKTMKHFWEEPCISGDENTCKQGSGAIFFSGCNLKCVFCQNYEISHEPLGKEISIQELAKIFKQFEKDGATNINLVTPSHYAESILQALEIYTPNIPIVWNSSGYDDPQMLEKIIKKVKVFLMDFKYYDNALANKYSKCQNYFENCTECLKLIKKHFPKNKYEDGLLTQGLIVRHMILPNHTKDSENILKWIAQNLGTNTAISLLAQYTPHGEAQKFEEINRKLKPIEYKKVLKTMQDLKLETGFVQDLESATTAYIPKFK